MAFGLSAGAIGLIGAGVGLYSASQQSNSVQNAANTQADASRAATEEQRRQADRTYADFQPYREAGGRALGLLEKGINQQPTAADVMSDLGYQFGLDQGQRGLDRKVAASGGRVSGAALKSAAEYATNYATNGYNAAYQRRQDRMNRLATLAGVGQTSTGASAAAGSNSTNAISSLISEQGNANAAAQLARGNIWGNAINQVGAGVQRYSGNNNQFSPQEIQRANSWNVPQYQQPAPDVW